MEEDHWSKFEANFDSLILHKIQQKLDILLCELWEYLEIRTGVKVSLSTMYRIFKKINISRKKKYLCFPSKREKILSKNVMSIENGWMIVDINNLVFVEISGINLGMTRLYGRGKVGERVISNVPRNKQVNMKSQL